MRVQQQVQKLQERSEDYKKALALEEQILAFSGLEINKQLHIYDVPVLGGKEWLHTVCCGHENVSTPPMLILHGYGNTLTTLFRMLAPLSKQNKVYAIDLPGMGLSSRPQFTLQGAEPVVEYLVSWVESWRETLNIDKFIIAGHSFGGYIAGNYAAKYPERILKLHLISPIGITHVDRDQLDRELAAMESELQWYKKPFYNYAKNAWNSGETLNSFYQKWWTPSGIFLDKFIEKRLQLKNQEAKSFKQFYEIIFRMPASCDKAFQQLFHLSKLRAFIPLQRELPKKITNNKNHFQVHFYFGDADWMDPSGARALHESQTIKCTFDLIPKSGHNINVDQPQILSDLIIKYNKEINSI